MQTYSTAFCITAPSSGEGKTTLAMGLMRLLSRTHKVQAFKCGPDYVDTSYHAIASKNTSYNLDTWLMGEKEVINTFTKYHTQAEISIIEGVMGFFDGKKYEENIFSLPSYLHSTQEKNNLPNIEGSTAHIAKLLQLPVIMVINAKGMAQSISAIVRGFYEQAQEYSINLVGIIANNIGSERHYQILQESLTAWNLPPLLGYVPKNIHFKAKERQLGLNHIFQTNEELEEQLDLLADILEKHIDITKLLSLTHYQNTLKSYTIQKKQTQNKKIGIAYDEAFCFYYPENLHYLENNGYELYYFSPLKDKKLPNVHAIYLGGGYPEIYADLLSKNTQMRQAIFNFAENNGYIFAECGGYMYLCSKLITTNEQSLDHKNLEQAHSNIYPMCNVIKATAIMRNRLHSLGYKQGYFCNTPFFLDKKITYFRGHEFHWSNIKLEQDYTPFLTINNQQIGIIYKNVFASYMHFYFANSSICE